MQSPVRLVVGLGNPGARYARTRHNAGFWFADALAFAHNGVFRQAARFFAESCEISLSGARIRLLKPDTFMNRSGQAVASIARYFQLPVEEILIAHDEIDLPPGTVRLKRGGGHGGHNGLRDVLSALGEGGFLRLRIGVGHPGHKDLVHDYVLHPASAEEQSQVDAAIDNALEVMPLVAAAEHNKAMTRLNRRAPGPAAATDADD